jgi:hypothetical protein
MQLHPFRVSISDTLPNSVQRDLFTEEGLALFKQETARLLAEHRRTTTPEIVTLKAQLTEIDQQIANMLTPLNRAFVPRLSRRTSKRPNRTGHVSKLGSRMTSNGLRR